MKKCLISVLSLILLVFSSVGCATTGGQNNWTDNVQQVVEDAHMFSKLATRIILVEAKTEAEDVELIRGYLVALKDLLAVPGEPDFTGAKALVSTKLPPKYHVYGVAVVDLIERYVRTVNFNLNEDQEAIINVISAVIDGSLSAVEEFAS